MFLLFFVGRSKLVLDFTLTIHFIHLVVTSLYSRSLPTNHLWWALQVASVAFMSTLGIWSCQWRELRPINFGSGASSRDSEAQNNGEAEGGVGERNESGKRGRGRDGSGEYEMVAMSEGANSKVRG